MAVGTEATLACRACGEAIDRANEPTPYVEVTVEDRETGYVFCTGCSPFVLDLLDAWRTRYASEAGCSRCGTPGKSTGVEARVVRDRDGFRSVGVRSYRLCPDCLPEVEAL
jgi:hypothetical protein